MRRRTFAAALAACFAGASMFPSMALAENNYPAREVKIVIPFAPGGGTDVIFRVLSDRAEKTLGQTIVPMNMGGAGGSKGSTYAKSQKPDGYTILGGHDFLFTTYYTGLVNFNYDAFEPVCMLTKTPLTLTVRPGVPYKNALEMRDYVKANPGKVVIAMTPGSMGYVFWKNLSNDWGIDLDKYFKVVIINGSGAQMKALLGGHIDAFAGDIPTDREYVKDGRAKELGVYYGTRLTQAPDVPALKEYGWSEEVVVNRFIVAPKGTPKEAIDKLAAAYKAACDDPETAQKIVDLGNIVSYMNPEETAAFLKRSDELYAKYLSESK